VTKKKDAGRGGETGGPLRVPVTRGSVGGCSTRNGGRGREKSWVISLKVTQKDVVMTQLWVLGYHTPPFSVSLGLGGWVVHSPAQIRGVG